jgi:hypothetical protein
MPEKELRLAFTLVVALVVIVSGMCAFHGTPTLADADSQHGLATPFPHPQPGRWTAGVTSVSGLSPEEQERLCGVPLEALEGEQLQAGGEATRVSTSYTYPSALDWRNIGGEDWTTPIRYQGLCGSCVAFGTIGAIESRMEIDSGDPSLNPDLSESHLFYCGCGACCELGWLPTYALDFARNPGIADEGCFPYVVGDPPCNPCSDWQDRVTRIAGWARVTNTDDMKQALTESGPFEATMVVYEDFFDYVGGVYEHTWGDPVGGHAVTIVGYNDVDGYWIAKNSWDTWWGESGWFRIAYGECGIDNNAFVPYVSCGDPQEPNDTSGQATAISYGATLTDSNICLEGDVDYYSFAGSAGDSIVADIDAETIGSSLDSYLYLYDSDGVTELTHNDDYDGYDSYLVHTLPADGTYYLMVREYSHPSEGGLEYFYTISLTLNPPPTLAWTGETNYLNDGLHPEQGDASTSFEYRVLYTDDLDSAPNFVRVHILKNGVDISGSPFTMDYVTGDYDTGAIFSFSKSGLQNGSDFTYYFEAQDNQGADATPTTELDAPDVNNAPTLAWTGETDYLNDGLHPEQGDASTSFEYRVLYTDDLDSAPNFVRVHILKNGVDISGSPFTMDYLSGDYDIGATFSFSKSGLQSGSDFTYYFEAQDNQGADATPTTEMDAPDVWWYAFVPLLMTEY